MKKIFTLLLFFVGVYSYGQTTILLSNYSQCDISFRMYYQDVNHNCVVSGFTDYNLISGDVVTVTAPVGMEFTHALLGDMNDDSQAKAAIKSLCATCVYNEPYPTSTTYYPNTCVGNIVYASWLCVGPDVSAGIYLQ